MRVPSLAFVIAPLLLFACDREPVAPEIAPPLFSATHGEFVIEGTDDFTDYVPCANDGLGELLQWSGPFRVTFRTVTSPSGNELWKNVGSETLDGYLVEGVTSGDVWTILESRAIGRWHFKHNGNWNRNTVWLDRYENQDGDRMFIQTTLHVTVANGAWRVARIGINACSLY